MSLKECISSEKFDENAANTPNIARITPAQIENDLWRPVMSGRHDGGMILVVESSGAKVNQPDLRI